MKLIEDERNLIESEDKVVLLTTHRIRYNAEKIGVTYFGSIMLDEVALCTISRKSKPVFMVLGVLTLLFGLYQMSKGYSINSIIPILVVSAIFFIIYYVTVKKYLEVASAGSSILMNTSRMSMSKIVEFVDEVESAKHNLHASLK